MDGGSNVACLVDYSPCLTQFILEIGTEIGIGEVYLQYCRSNIPYPRIWNKKIKTKLFSASMNVQTNHGDVRNVLIGDLPSGTAVPCRPEPAFHNDDTGDK